MTPKKAIVIVLILFLITAMVFVFLYLKQQLSISDNNNRVNIPTDLIGQPASSSVQQKIEAIEIKTREQIEQIVEQGRTETGGVTVEAQRKIEDAVNQEIMEKLKLRTPEQTEADKQKQAEREKIEQEINQQIKDQLQNK